MAAASENEGEQDITSHSPSVSTYLSVYFSVPAPRRCVVAAPAAEQRVAIVGLVLVTATRVS
jgi:hypothetical protein